MSDSTRVLRIPQQDALTDLGSQVDPLTPLTSPTTQPSSDLFQTLQSGPIVIHTAPPSCPVSFPGYDIIGELGRGGMGVVYRAKQRSLNRAVALKVIIAGPHASAEDKTRFRLEAEAGARLRHPNIVQVYDVGEHAGFAYMALELVEGGTLRRWQAEKPVAPKLAVQLAMAVGRGILHAHEHGIVHRDLKPANILLGTEESVPGASDCQTEPDISLDEAQAAPPPVSLVPKVTDFGLAKTIEGGTDLTVPGMACGTPNYMAPEQVRGDRRVGMGVDVYGLGAVLFELLTGCPPFGGSDAAEVMEKILRTEAPSVRKHVPTLPGDLAVIVAKCLEKDSARRYLTIRDLLDDLDRFLAGLPIQARPVGPIGRASRWVRRNPVPAVFLMLTACGLTITSGLVVALTRSVSFEKHARADAELMHGETDDLRKAAEMARDELRVALVNAQTQKAAAEHARKNAEANLQIARQVIRTTFYEFSRDSRFERPEFRGYREKLIVSVRRFRDEVAVHAEDSGEWLNDLADVSHWLGFLEYLNGDLEKSAVEYWAAADAARKWAATIPNEPEPRWKLSDSLVNAGNAWFQHQQHREAEAAYREALAVMVAVVEEHPSEKHRRMAILARARLAIALRFTGNVVEQVQLAAVAYRDANLLAVQKSSENQRVQALAKASLALAVMRLGSEVLPERRLLERHAEQGAEFDPLK